jgi:hypothetical protein
VQSTDRSTLALLKACFKESCPWIHVLPIFLRYLSDVVHETSTTEGMNGTVVIGEKPWRNVFGSFQMFLQDNLSLHRFLITLRR